jgi:hypothetical protein
MRTLCLWAAAMLAALPCCGAASVRIRVDNQTYDTVYLRRIGDPNTSVLVPKRMVGQFEVPLVGEGSPALEALLIGFPGNVTVPETEFRGFNGKYAQAASLVIASPQTISIAYEQTGNGNSGVANQPGNSNTKPAGYYGGAFSGGYGVGRANYIGSLSNRPPENTFEASARIIQPPRKRLLLPEKAGAKVKVVPADSRYKLIEAPVSIRGQAKEIAKASAPASVIQAPAQDKKAGRGALITWIVVCIALVGFVAWKRLSSR